MSARSATRCPHCAPTVAKYGENYHRVYDRVDATLPAGTQARCEGCGGCFNGERWIYVCKSCKTDVPAGALTGLFVPHSCVPCLDKVRAQQRATGRVCGRCKLPTCDCCC